MYGGTIQRYLVLDVETTTFKKGHPFAERNKLCYVGIKRRGYGTYWTIENDSEPYAAKLAEIQAEIDGSDIIVLFNGKFDLHWLRRYGINFSHKRVWDCQLAEFILSNQLNRFPSLDDASKRIGRGGKFDVVAELWKQGIDTPQIPESVMVPYLMTDLEETEALYLHQLGEFETNGKLNLLRLHNDDLLVLEEMEANGILFSRVEMQQRAESIRGKRTEVHNKLEIYCDSWPHFNWASGNHLSCLLYGGTVNVDVATPYKSVAKSGKLAGQIVTRNRWSVVSKTFPKLVEPIKGSALKKAGYWATDEGHLKQLKGASKLIKLLLEKAEYDKLLSTYYDGIPSLLEEYDWQDGIVHGQLNQVTVVTGRLSAEKPNQQNFVAEINQYIKTRFDVGES